MSNWINKAQAGVQIAGQAFQNFNNLSQVNDRKDIDNNIAANRFTGGLSSNASLLNTWSTYRPLEHLSASDFRNGFGDVGSVIGSTLSGAAAGSSFGPWGAAAGAVVGLGSSLAGIFTGKSKARKAARRANSRIDAANNSNLGMFISNANNLEDDMDDYLERNFYGYGGRPQVVSPNLESFRYRIPEESLKKLYIEYGNK